MKRRNAETGKMRRPLKRTKITEGMYGNSMLYLKFVMIWATVVMADYMLEFRFEFLWPFWIMLRSVYDSFKYQGLAFSVFFICIALTSDMICFFFIPLQYIFFAASTYVWVQYVWYTFADKGICVPTVAICCLLVYVEGLWRGSRGGSELCRPLAAHCVGYPVVSLGFGAKALIAHRLRQRRQRHVRAMNEFYFQLMRDALPETALDQSQQQTGSKEGNNVPNGTAECAHTQTQTNTQSHTQSQTQSHTHMNGSLRRRCYKGTDRTDHNGHCVTEHAQLQAKLEKLEKHLAAQTAAREKANAQSNHCSGHATTTLGNGSVTHAALDDDDRHEHTKGGAKNSKLDKKESSSTLKEEKRKNKNRDKDKDNNDSHKSTEHKKEEIVKDKEMESTKENVKVKECNSSKDKEKERERERETREKEKEREREREQREARECQEELKRIRSELSLARSSEAEARRALAASAAGERQRRAELASLKQAHAALQARDLAARNTERRLADERRARTHLEHQLRSARHAARNTQPAAQPATGAECDSATCRARRAAAESDAATLRRDLARARERHHALTRDLAHATEQVRSLEARQEQAAAVAAGLGAWAALAERAAHLERALSAETRVKLDLLSALGDAQRKMHIQESVISGQEKQLEELKAQMLAVMPVSSVRLGDGSALDPNACVYTPHHRRVTALSSDA